MRVLLLAGLVAGTTVAQPMPAPAQACVLGQARVELVGADVRAGLYNNGNLFFGTAATAAQYDVPRDSLLSPIYAADFWLAGKVGGEVRAAASTYDRFDYRPGLIGADRTAPTRAECEAADRIWTVSRLDVERYDATGVATADLAAWPVRLGAPTRDGDGIADNFNLAGGDRPLLSGDVTAFWAMTDAATGPRYGGGLPLGVDVTVEAFAFRLAQPALRTATFYRYRVTNRSAAPIDSLHAGIWFDYELGYASDDLIGTDTTLAMVYVYNADDSDDGDATGYGMAPPAVGTVVLQSPDGPDGRPLGLTAVPAIWKSAAQPLGDPVTPDEVYQRMRGRFNDGTPMTTGGDGYLESGPETVIAFPGDPVTDQFWSETNSTSTGTGNAPGDRRAMLATGPITLAPDSTATLLYGIVYGRGTSHMNSITVLRTHAVAVRHAQAAGYFDARAAALPPPPEPPPLALRRPAPNPFTGSTVLRLEGVPSGLALTVRVVDVLGREVERHAVAEGTTSVRLGAGLAPGIYVVEVAGLGITAAPIKILKTD